MLGPISVHIKNIINDKTMKKTNYIRILKTILRIKVKFNFYEIASTYELQVLDFYESRILTTKIFLIAKSG